MFPDALPPQPARSGLIDELADAMTCYFFTAGDAARSLPHFYAVLSHQYTLRSLKHGLELLKGRDRGVSGGGVSGGGAA